MATNLQRRKKFSLTWGENEIYSGVLAFGIRTTIELF
jgi:hypothetical protein